MKIEFTYPYLLLLLIPFLAVVIIAYIRKKTKRKLIFLIVRCLMGIMLIFALSGIGISWTNKEITTVFLVDVSDSASAYSNQAKNYLKKQLSGKPDNNQVGIVAFGKSTSVEQFISEANTFTEFSSQPISTATDIEAAINYAAAIMPQDTAKRIVLLTDGQENTGDISNNESVIKSQDIELDVVTFNSEQKSEAYVSNIAIPEKISIGEQFTISATVESNVSCDAKLYLYSGRTVKGSKDIKLEKGTNRYVFKDTQTDVGMKNYKVILELDDAKDSLSINNEYSAYTIVNTKPRLLVIEGSKGEGSEFTKLLDSIGSDYTIGDTQIAPSNINELNEYKGVVLVNVHADDLNKGFKDNLDSYVSNYGGSVIATGGDNSFALGKYKDTSLEKVLPVTMELKGKKEIPKMAMALVIDHSGSMTAKEGANTSNLTIAKNAAIEATNTLREKDEIGVIAFADNFKWVVDLQENKDKDELNSLISGISEGGGTSIYPALAAAEKEIAKSDAKIKHIILLTDGQDNFNAYDDVISDIKDNSITLSTVAVGKDADSNLLEALSKQGNGRFYQTNIETNLPRIFAQEVFLSIGEYLVNREFNPVIANYSNILTNVADKGLPTMLGYVAATPKDNAKVLLESDSEEPILSVMQYGVGRTVAWNSDVDNDWTKYYAGTTQYQTLWNNILNWAMTDTSSKGSGVTVSENASVINVKYKTESKKLGSDVSVVVTDEEGKEKTIPMNMSAPGEYAASIDADKTGIYSLNIRESNSGEIVNSITTSAVVQYSKEYRVFEYSDDFAIKAKNIGANQYKLSDDAFASKLKLKAGNVDFVDFCLLLALILFAIDIVFRRLQLNEAISGLLRRIKAERNKEDKKEKKAVEVTKTSENDIVEKKVPIIQTVDNVKVKPANKNKKRKKLNQTNGADSTASALLELKSKRNN